MRSVRSTVAVAVTLVIAGVVGAAAIGLPSVVGVGRGLGPFQLVANGPTPGRVCMFNAPTGAPLPPFGTAGHVGWGLREGSSSNWIFGATENANDVWQQSGSFEGMLSAFRAQRPGVVYYTRYRCTGTDTAAVDAAVRTAGILAARPYNGLFNNCLTQAVAIFTAYGAANMPQGRATPPNSYFLNTLQNLNWEPVVNL